MDDAATAPPDVVILGEVNNSPASWNRRSPVLVVSDDSDDGDNYDINAILHAVEELRSEDDDDIAAMTAPASAPKEVVVEGAEEAPAGPDEGGDGGAVGVDRDQLATVVGQVIRQRKGHPPTTLQLADVSELERVRSPHCPSILGHLRSSSMALFPDCLRSYLEQLIPERGWWDPNVVCNFLLEEPGYPRGLVQELVLLPESSVFLSEEKEAELDYFDAASLDNMQDAAYQLQAVELLRHDFPVLMVVDLRTTLRRLKHRYALTRLVLSKAVKSWLDNGGKSHSSRGKREVIPVSFHEGSLQLAVNLRILERRRRSEGSASHVQEPLHPELLKELQFFEAKMRQQNEHADLQLAMLVNEQQYKEEQQAIECGCCFAAVPFEEMTQCLDGHLFCKDCLVRYAQEAVYGQAGAQLQCMVSGCEEGFPQSELQKTLSQKILLKLSERQAEQDVSSALRDELLRCPFCDFAAMLEQNSIVFVCPNPRCKKSSCRKCREDWKDHAGLTCEEVESQSQVKFRISMEERMSAARIRKCPRCGTALLKSEGCNKLSCRCGGTMCNVCRTPNIGYDHFCQHPLIPGQPCPHCTACLLWVDPEKEDDQLIERIQTEAHVVSGEAAKRIGPPLDPDEPKQRRVDNQQPRHRHHHHFGHHQHHPQPQQQHRHHHHHFGHHQQHHQHYHHFEHYQDHPQPQQPQRQHHLPLPHQLPWMAQPGMAERVADQLAERMQYLQHQQQQHQERLQLLLQRQQQRMLLQQQRQQQLAMRDMGEHGLIPRPPPDYREQR
ncbi:E3 ubiquitin-protein ligase RNF216 isoform X2 [Lampetra planeri]